MEIDNYIERLSKAAKAYKNNATGFVGNKTLLDELFFKVIGPLADTWEKGELLYQQYLKIDRQMPKAVAGGGRCRRCARLFKEGEGYEYTFGQGLPVKVCSTCYSKLTERQKPLLISKKENK